MTPLALVRLFTWLSPAFPTGGFAYSHGLEWSVAAGDVGNEAALGAWLEDLLAHGALRSDAILLRHTLSLPVEELPALAALATAIAPCLERRLETLAQGAAFREAARAWPAPLLEAWGAAPLPYPVAVGLLARAQAIAVDDAVPGFLQAASANLVSAAIRLIPLGQSAGLRVQAGLEPAILACAAASETATLADLGGFSLRCDIAAMRHETQETRLFRT